MGLSYSEELRRHRCRIVNAQEKIAQHERARLDLDRAIYQLYEEVKLSEARIAEVETRKAERAKYGLKSVRTPVGEFSETRHIRLRQALHHVCDEADITMPNWVNAIGDADIRFASRDELLEFRDELAAKDSAQRVNRQKETPRGIDPSGTVESKAAGGNDVVDAG